MSDLMHEIYRLNQNTLTYTDISNTKNEMMELRNEIETLSKNFKVSDQDETCTVTESADHNICINEFNENFDGRSSQMLQSQLPEQMEFGSDAKNGGDRFETNLEVSQLKNDLKRVMGSMLTKEELNENKEEILK